MLSFCTFEINELATNDHTQNTALSNLLDKLLNDAEYWYAFVSGAHGSDCKLREPLADCKAITFGNFYNESMFIKLMQQTVHALPRNTQPFR